MKFLKKIFNFLRESKAELKKVTWPTKKETLQYTILVIIISLVLAIFLGGVDFILNIFLRKFIF